MPTSAVTPSTAAVTTNSPPVASERRCRRAVVYLYTQTGQLREVAEALTAPLETQGWDVRWVGVHPREAFPFPWPVRRFFGVFAQAVDPAAQVELRRLAEDPIPDPDELVILAYQVWYLAPSLPVRSLLKTHPEIVCGRRVLSLIACRNMWYSAAVEMSGLLQSAGARSVDVVAATDTRRSATTLVTTLRWLLTGQREGGRWLGRAGVTDDELSRVAEVGRSIAQSQPHPENATDIVPALALADLLAGRVFRRWGAAVRSARNHGTAAYAASVGIFALSLAVAIVIGLPLCAFSALAGGRRLSTAVETYVRHRIAFGTTTLSKEMAQ